MENDTVMNEVINDVTEVINSQFSPLLASLLLAITLFLSRYLLMRIWQNHIKSSIVERRKVASFSRGVVITFLIIGLILIWAPELHAFAISIAAFAVALVVGMKELILAALGGIYRLMTGAYKVGDLITVGNMRGEVVDFGLTSTTLERLGPGMHGSNYSGNRIIFPNSKLLIEPVINENENGPFVLHTILAPVNRVTDIEKARAVLEKASTDLVNLNEKEVHKFVKEMSQTLDFTLEKMKPNFELEYAEVDKGFIKMSLFLPLNKLKDIEFEILSSYMSWLRSSEISH